MAKIKVFIDGSGHPVNKSAFIVINENGEPIKQKVIQHENPTTNNQAEYKALIAALEHIRDNHKEDEVEIFTDSQLLAYQIEGKYKVNDTNLKALHSVVSDLLKEIGENRVKISWISREYNIADALMRKWFLFGKKNNKTP